jgi:hypothetical protein
VRMAYGSGVTMIEMLRMSREEKLKVMHALWEDLAREDEAVESPAWHGDALRETEARVVSGVERVRDWNEAKAELRRRAG